MAAGALKRFEDALLRKDLHSIRRQLFSPKEDISPGNGTLGAHGSDLRHGGEGHRDLAGDNGTESHGEKEAARE